MDLDISICKKIYKNFLVMMKDRGEKIIPVKNISKYYNKSIEALTIDIDKETTLVISTKPKFFAEYYRNIIAEINSSNRIFIIINDKAVQGRTHKVTKTWVDMNVTIYPYSMFLFPLTRHILVPKHILIKKNEIPENMLQDIQYLPKILITDKISVWFDAQIGDLFKIIRTQSECPSIAYRCVIHKSSSLKDP